MRAVSDWATLVCCGVGRSAVGEFSWATAIIEVRQPNKVHVSVVFVIRRLCVQSNCHLYCHFRRYTFVWLKRSTYELASHLVCLPTRTSSTTRPISSNSSK